MRIFAYCDRRYEKPSRKLFDRYADGGLMRTSPPVTVATFDPTWLESQEVIYLDLHGLPGARYLYADGEYALDVDTVRGANLGGAVVFATSCYMSETPFLRAFLDAGASAVITGEGENYGGRWKLTGAGKLAWEFLKWRDEGFMGIDNALGLAKLELASYRYHRIFHRKATQDALAFRVWR